MNKSDKEAGLVVPPGMDIDKMLMAVAFKHFDPGKISFKSKGERDQKRAEFEVFYKALYDGFQNASVTDQNNIMQENLMYKEYGSKMRVILGS